MLLEQVSVPSKVTKSGLEGAFWLPVVHSSHPTNAGLKMCLKCLIANGVL